MVTNLTSTPVHVAHCVHINLVFADCDRDNSSCGNKRGNIGMPYSYDINMMKHQLPGSIPRADPEGGGGPGGLPPFCAMM